MDQEKRFDMLAELVEVFESFLNRRGINIPNEDKKQSDHPCNIYGMDFGELTGGVEDVLIRHGLLDYAFDDMEASVWNQLCRIIREQFPSCAVSLIGNRRFTDAVLSDLYLTSGWRRTGACSDADIVNSVQRVVSQSICNTYPV